MRPWWQSAVVYQIYPRSFQDSNGDGIGDLPGISQRLPYLAKLGIDAIWLSPVYRSPDQDNGYDISDYRAIDPKYGTMADMHELIKTAQTYHIKLIMDLVVNHTSDEHPWFVAARQSRDSPYRDFYIWRDPVAGHEPNVLTSSFSGSAWQFDNDSKQYYLHFFAAKQPDLNWQQPKLRQAIYDMMNFWIDQGIGGFRMDVIDLIGKEPDRLIRENGPKLHSYLQEMNRATFGGKNLLTVGETWGVTPKLAPLYSDPKRHELSMVFQFEQMMLDQQPGREKWDLLPIDLGKLKAVLVKWQVALDFNQAWNSLFWENHDLPRIVSRWGDDGRYRVRSAKMFAIVLHLLRGTPYIYQGEEIGMTNKVVHDIDEVNDIESRNMYHERLAAGASKAALIHAINVKGRDNARTPMQWSTGAHAGFTPGTPWLDVNPNYPQINVAAAINDSGSIFYTYQKLIKLRHENDVVVSGRFELVPNLPATVLAYYRILGSTRWLVVANLSKRPAKISLSDRVEEVLVANVAVPSELTDLRLSPYAAFAAVVAK